MAATGHHAPKNELHPFHLPLLVVGGLCLGTGLVQLIGSFGWPGGDLNSRFDQIGWSAIDNIGLLPPGFVSIPLIVCGALAMIIANATAWKETGGY
jgi:hypothetical protein